MIFAVFSDKSVFFKTIAITGGVHYNKLMVGTDYHIKKLQI